MPRDETAVCEAAVQNGDTNTPGMGRSNGPAGGNERKKTTSCFQEQVMNRCTPPCQKMAKYLLRRQELPRRIHVFPFVLGISCSFFTRGFPLLILNYNGQRKTTSYLLFLATPAVRVLAPGAVVASKAAHHSATTTKCVRVEHR